MRYPRGSTTLDVVAPTYGEGRRQRGLRWPGQTIQCQSMPGALPNYPSSLSFYGVSDIVGWSSFLSRMASAKRMEPSEVKWSVSSRRGTAAAARTGQLGVQRSPYIEMYGTCQTVIAWVAISWSTFWGVELRCAWTRSSLLSRIEIASRRGSGTSYSIFGPTIAT